VLKLVETKFGGLLVKRYCGFLHLGDQAPKNRRMTESISQPIKPLYNKGVISSQVWECISGIQHCEVFHYLFWGIDKML
jgi:hypothetical protein